MSPWMDLDELLNRESEQVEWKAGVADADDAARTLVAFANDFGNLGGGHLVAGVREVRDPHGFVRAERVGLSASEAKEVEGRVRSALLDGASPRITPQVEEHPGPTPDTRILVFFVRADGEIHTYRTRVKETGCPIRLGAETKDARNGLYLSLLDRKAERPPWDRRAAPGATLGEVDLLALRDLLERLGLWDVSRPVESWLDPSVPLSPMAPPLVVADGGVVRPANFALLLLGRRPTLHCPGAWTQLSIYPGVERGTDQAVLHEIDGTLPQQVERVMAILKDQSPLLIDKRSAQANQAKYPERALLEATANALVHRDYTLDDPTRITVFSDRIEFSSPGGLQHGVDPAEFAEGRAHAVWRNQSLAWFFRKLGLAQAEGQGLGSIRAALASTGGGAPRFLSEPARVVCVLPAHPRGQTLADLARVRRLLDTDRDHEAWDEALTTWEREPAHPTAIELLVEAAARAGKLPEARKRLDAHGTALWDLSVSARVTLLEAELLAAPSGESLSDLSESTLEALSGMNLSAAQLLRLARALVPTGRLNVLFDTVEGYVDQTNPAARDRSVLQQAANVALAEVDRLRARETNTSLTALTQARAGERIDALLPLAQQLNRWAEDAAFRARDVHHKAALDAAYARLEAVGRRHLAPSSPE